MKKPTPTTVKAYIQTPNKQGLARVGIHFYDGKLSAVGLGVSVPAKQWDKRVGLASSRYIEHQTVNAMVRLHCQLMEQAAATVKGWHKVKPVYLELVRQHEQQALESTRARKWELFTDIVAADDAAEAKEQAEIALSEAVKTLRRVAKKGIVLETEATKEYNKMLEMYPAKFVIQNSGEKVKQQITAFINRLKIFSNAEGYSLTFQSMNAEFYATFANWLMFRQPDSATKYFNSYFGANIKKLKTFLAWCEGEGIAVNPQYRKFKVLSEEKEIVYLTDEELHLLSEYASAPTCNSTYQKYIDFTLFQSLTGLRYSDVQANKWKVEAGFIKGTAKKNKGNFKIPLTVDAIAGMPGMLAQLLAKYPDGFRNNDGKKLFSEQNYNDTLKVILHKLFSLHNINQKPINIYKHKLDREYKFKYLKHELLSSHSNRRAFCTRAINAGYTEKEVLTIIGSKSMVELRRYTKVEEQSLLAKTQRLSALQN